MLTIEDLPEEVLMLLFSYLRFRDRQNARLVNRRWLDLSDSSSLTKRDVFVVKEGTNLNQYRLHRRHINLRIVDLQYPLQHLGFWEEHGPFVRSIEMYEVDLKTPKLYAIIIYCPNIQFLSLITRQPSHLWFRQPREEEAKLDVDYVEKACGQLKNLLGLDVMFAKTVTGADFYRFTKYASQLQCLRIGCFLELNDLAVKAIVSKPLKKLTFSPGSGLTENTLDFVRHIGPQLTALCIPAFLGHLDDWLPILAEKFPFLEELGLSMHRGALKDPLLLLALKNLKFLSLKGTLMGNNVLSAVIGLEHLRGLDMTACMTLTEDGIVQAFGHKLHPNLVDLRLNGVFATTDPVLARILPRLPNVKNLYLQGCKYITRDGLTSIINNCKLLEILSFKNCIEIVDLFNPVSINSLKRLRYLNVENCNVSEELPYKLQLSELVTIRLHGALELSVEGFRSLLTNCPSLRDVYCQINNDDQEQMQTVSEDMDKPFSLKTRPVGAAVFDFFADNM